MGPTSETPDAGRSRSTSISGNFRGLSKGSRRTQFKRGQVGNPRGRPKGSHNKVTKDFVAALQEHFEIHGADAIARMSVRDPAAYVRLCASIVNRHSRASAPCPQCAFRAEMSVAKSGVILQEIRRTLGELIEERLEKGEVLLEEVEKIMHLLGIEEELRRGQ